jgi:hypothetical protein
MSDHPNEANTVTLNTLLRKRADVVFDIAEAEKAVERLRTELVYLDAVIRMFQPAIAEGEMPVRLRRTRNASPYFARGELTKRIYDALRERSIIGSADIAADAMRAKGINPEADNATRKDFVRRVSVQLNSLALQGKVERVGKGRSQRWRLATEAVR